MSNATKFLCQMLLNYSTFDCIICYCIICSSFIVVSAHEYYWFLNIYFYSVQIQLNPVVVAAGCKTAKCQCYLPLCHMDRWMWIGWRMEEVKLQRDFTKPSH